MNVTERSVAARVGAVVVAALCLAALLGFQFGQRATTETTTGPAQWIAGPDVVNIGGLGWYYQPEWVDAMGTYHSGSSRPACLPADGRAVERLTYDFVTAQSDGQTRRVLVLIRCGE